MMKRNLRFAIFTVSMVALMVTMTFLPASAQLSQWRSLNPTRDGIVGPPSRVAPAPYLYGVQMLTSSYGWAVGGTCDIFTNAGTCPGSGFALFWDGARWRQILVPATAGTLTSVFIVGANDVWAVGMQDTTGKATIIHWDGISWAAATVPVGITDLFSVFILPGGMDGWAVGRVTGAGTNILRWSGMWPTGAWSAFSTPLSTRDLRGVFLISPTEGWAVGTTTPVPPATIFHWDGAGWIDATISSPTTNNLYSVFAVSPTDAWAVGASASASPYQSTIIRWNGASWTGPMVAPTSNIDYHSIHMISGTDGWIAGGVDPTTGEGLLLHWNGVAWAPVRSLVTVGLNDVFMLPGGSDGLAVGDAETIVRWNGSKWFAQTSPTDIRLNAVSMVATNDGWAVGDNGTIFNYDGISWAHYETLPSGVNLNGLDMRATNDGWAVGDSPPPLTSPSGGFPPVILRWNGAAWTPVTPSGVALGQKLYAVDIVSATESWAVGNGTITAGAAMLKWDGTLWTSVPSGTPAGTSLYGINMLSSTDGWAVGCTDPTSSCQSSIIVRWNGLAWSAVTPPSGIHGLRDIFMLSPTNGWAVGYASAAGGQATIIHWDGSQWTSVPGPTVGGVVGVVYSVLNSVHMTSPTDGWAVGNDTTSPGKSLIVHWDGLTWNVVATLPLPPSMAVSLNSVFMVASLDGWIVSDQGLILHYGPESVPGTTTSITTVIQTTTSTGSLSTTTSSSSATTSTSTTTSIPPSPVPGFPIESILAGLVGGIATLAVLRRRRKFRS